MLNINTPKSKINKKASSFFLFDAVIAVFIFFIAILIIFANISEPVETDTTREYAESLINYLTDIEIRDIDNELVNKLIAQDLIKRPQEKLINQIVIIKNHSPENVTDFVRTIVEQRLPQRMGYSVTIDETEIYKRESINQQIRSTSKVRRLVISRLYDDSIKGPIIFELGVWY